MPKLFLIRAYQINVLNLIPALAFRIGGDNVNIPTTWEVHNGIFYMPETDQTCDKVTSMVNWSESDMPEEFKLRNAFRYIKWSNNEDVLKKITSTNKFQILSTSIDDEIHFVKEQLSDDVVTIGVHYEDSDNEDLLRSMAKAHIYYSNMGWIDSSDSILSEDEYMKKFSQMNLIGKSTEATYDHSVNFKDFPNKKLIEDLFIDIGLPFNSDGHDIYDRWLSNN